MKVDEKPNGDGAPKPDGDEKPGDQQGAKPGEGGVETPKKNAPEKYELKLGEGSHLEATEVERVAAIARELDLSQDGAAKVFGHLELVVGERVKAQLDELQPGGPAWTKQVEQWEGEVLKDAEIGGTPEKVQESITLAKGVLETYFDKSVMEFLSSTGAGSHPGVVRGFVKLAKAMGEGKFIKTGETPPPPKKSLEEKFYSQSTSSQE